MLAACGGEPGDEAVADDEAEVSASAFKVITHNIAGATEGGDKALDYVTDQARSWNPDVVMMQEACESQVATLKARFPKWDVRFSPMRVDDGCANGKKGVVLASKWNMSDLEVTDLGEAFGRQFSMLCADVAKSGAGAHSIRACSTHLRAWDDPEAEPMRIKQTGLIHDALEKRIKQRNQAVIVAGDFNSGPHRAPHDNMYRQALDGKLDGPGLFREADQNDKRFFVRDPMAPERVCAPTSCRSGQDTHENPGEGSGGSKLDYIFFSTNRAQGAVSGTVMGHGGSDHHQYRGVAELTSK
jgi:endonuclease/exonuclease/phosphatase family metal-dependent hydrolase